jgi:hypothetical protein
MQRGPYRHADPQRLLKNASGSALGIGAHTPMAQLKLIGTFLLLS